MFSLPNTFFSVPTSTPIVVIPTPPFAYSSGYDASTVALIEQTDGKIVVGGTFTSYDGVVQRRYNRLNLDGTNDGTLVQGLSIAGGSPILYGIAQQPADGKLILVGQFQTYVGISSNGIVRVTSTGAYDGSFAVGTGFASNDARRIALQPDGKVIVGGNFTSFNGVSSSNIARLNTNGSYDSSFAIGTGFNGTTIAIALQPDGKVLVGGGFSFFNGGLMPRIVRLNSNGSVDTGFIIGSSFNGLVYHIYVQTNGKILVGGDFTTYNGSSASRIIRLNSDGSIDSTFNSGTGFNSSGKFVTVQYDGKILVGGNFTTYNGSSASRIIRLNSDGSIDSTFNSGTGFNSGVERIVQQTDGKIVVSGTFTTYNGTGRNFIVRLKSDGSLDT